MVSYPAMATRDTVSKDAPVGGVVYFIRCECGDDGPIKIGWSQRDASGRLSQVQTGSPFPLTLLAQVPVSSRSVETVLHERLQLFWMRGEWFRNCQQVRDALTVFQVSGNVDDVPHFGGNPEFQDRYTNKKHRPSVRPIQPVRQKARDLNASAAARDPTRWKKRVADRIAARRIMNRARST
jgi:hypothetical protein